MFHQQSVRESGVRFQNHKGNLCGMTENIPASQPLFRQTVFLPCMEHRMKPAKFTFIKTLAIFFQNIKLKWFKLFYSLHIFSITWLKKQYSSMIPSSWELYQSDSKQFWNCPFMHLSILWSIVPDIIIRQGLHCHFPFHFFCWYRCLLHPIAFEHGTKGGTIESGIHIQKKVRPDVDFCHVCHHILHYRIILCVSWCSPLFG